MSKRSYLQDRLSALPDFVFSFIEHYYDGDSVNTQIAYSIDIKTFLVFLQKYKFPEIENPEDFTPAHMEAVTAEDLLNFRAYLKEYEVTTQNAAGNPVTRTLRNSPFGINRKLSSIRSLFLYLYKTDKIRENITDKVDMMSLHQKIKQPLTAQETVRILDVLFEGEKYFEGRDLTEYLNRKQRDIAIFITYLGTGVRVSELINLNVDDVSFETSSFIVTRKGGEQQEIFMPLQVENELAKYIYEVRRNIDTPGEDALFVSRRGQRMSVAAVEKNLKKYCHAAGVYHKDKTRPHALRRTFACSLLEDGVDIKMVAELMGHKNIEVTHKFYAQYSSQKRKEVMRSHTVFDQKELEELPKPNENQ